ncbi:UDP-N-acetylmuramoyl-L-alanine--D-glutamate ligase [Patescibacteria group bacterium]|nr:UDP-N-acetylmuramoyl-L-alanine--D-glutamate ligase [Patescibacteria group bacterium]MBU1906837.1 UDP-N-acetylmuramoyl-L-alanine--D-glutamate ligase [Patescibacteria group bacterium]
MKPTDFQDAVVTVMGLGRYLQGSGVGATKWLMRHGAQTVITDLQSEEELADSIEEVMKWFAKYEKEYPDRTIYKPIFVLGEHRADDFVGANFVVQNPGVPRESEFVRIAKENGIPVLSDIAIFYELYPHPIYAVTGAKGKSTTTSMIGEILKATDPQTVVAGNIKVSPLEFIDELLTDSETHPVVLELSSWLLESVGDINRGPEIALITNLYEEHLNRYDSFEDYVAAKKLIFKNQKPDQFCVLNYDQDVVRKIEPEVPSKVVWFSLKDLPAGQQGAFLRDGEFVWRFGESEEVLMKAEELGLTGEHNIANALAAIAVARLANVPNEVIVATMKSFKGIPDRQEIVTDIAGVTFVNDTTATAPAAAVAAMKRFGQKGNVVLLAGGADKGLAFDEMAKTIGATCKYVVLFEGEATDKLAKAMGKSVPSVRVNSMAEAVEAATKVAESGDTILLSPGCASFGIFKNEFDRGDQFKEVVSKL